MPNEELRHEAAPSPYAASNAGGAAVPLRSDSVTILPDAGQPVVIEQRAVPATVPAPAPRAEREVVIVSHSPLFYWWPVWVTGFILAAVTRYYGEPHMVGDRQEYFYTSANVGVAFFLTLFLVIVITNVSVRGLASVMVVLAAITITVTLAYYGLWDRILNWFAGLNIHLNFGAYFWFSVLMFLTWALTVFVIDPLSYWRIKAGQITRVYVLGAASKSFDTENMVFEKFRDDLFRHWVLGLGSGDLRVSTHGARSEQIFIPNVLFVGSRMQKIHALIASEPIGPAPPAA